MFYEPEYDASSENLFKSLSSRLPAVMRRDYDRMFKLTVPRLLYIGRHIRFKPSQWQAVISLSNKTLH